jgi:hypothetical protein
MEQNQQDKHWTIRKEVSVGDLITFVFATVAALSAYHTLKTEVELVKHDVQIYKVYVETLKTDVADQLKTLNMKLDRLIEAKSEISRDR